jgi:hypothetical protein
LDARSGVPANGDRRAAHPSQGADATLPTASLDERTHSHDRALDLLERKADPPHQAPIKDEQVKSAKDTDLAAEQQRALAR